MHNNKKITLALVLSASVLTGCSSLFDWVAARNLDQPEGTVMLAGLQQPVEIRRDEYGVPLLKHRILPT